jgi:hypothetical protein
LTPHAHSPSERSFVMLKCILAFIDIMDPGTAKGQLNSECIYEVIVSLKMPTKNYEHFCHTKQTRIVKFIYSEKVTKFCEISTLLLTSATKDKSKVEI